MKIKWPKRDSGAPKPGDTFEKYRIERMLGRGGMGAVYLVHHHVLDSPFALKILFPEIASKNKRFVDRFIREAKLACRIRHPNLIAVYDAGRNPDNGMYYLVMDYVAGGSVRDLLRRAGRIAPGMAVSIVSQVAAALEAGHAHNMVHRDIKPDNIMFAGDGTVRLADLGIAKSVNEQDTMLTMEASVFGTPAYMSAEQAMDSRNVDCRADIYSLGIVFYEMITGERPYRGESAIEILSQVMKSENIPDVRTVCSDTPADVAELIVAMTEKDLCKRIQTPAELSERIGRISLPDGAAGTCGQTAVLRQPGGFEGTMPTIVPSLAPVTDVTLPQVAPAVPVATATMPMDLPGTPKAPKSRPGRRNILLAAGGAALVLICVVMLWRMMRPGAGPDFPAGGVAAVSARTSVSVPPAVSRAQDKSPAPEEETALPSGAVVLLGGASAERLATEGIGGLKTVFREAESAQFREQLKKIIASKPALVLLMLPARYAALDMSGANFELMIRAAGNLLRDGGVPFAFVLDRDDPGIPKVALFNRAVRELCKLQSYPMIESEAAAGGVIAELLRETAAP